MHHGRAQSGGRRRQRVRRRRGAAAAPGPPRRRDRRAHRRIQRRASGSARSSRTCVPLADRVLEVTTAEVLCRHDVVFLALPHGQSAAIAAQLARRHRGHRLRRRLPADRRRRLGALLRRRARRHRGPTGCPSCPASGPLIAGARGSRSPAATRPSSRLALAPAVAAGLVEPDVVVVAATRHLRRGQGRQAAPARLRGHGLRQRVRRGRDHRHTPEIIQNLSALTDADGPGARFTPLLAPMPRGILATCTAAPTTVTTPTRPRAAYEKAYADEPFVHLLPEGQWPQTPARAGLQRRAPAGRRRRRRRPPGGRRRAVDNLAKGTGGRSGAVHEPRARPPRGHRPHRRRSRPMSGHRPRAASGPPASPPGSSRAGTRTSRWWSTPARARRRRRSSPPTAARPHPVLWSRGGRQDGVVRAVVLNSGGANCCTGPEGFQTTHATAEQVAERLGIGAVDVAVCSTGLIGLRQPIGQAARRGRRGASPPWARTAARTPPTRIMTTDTRPQAGRRRAAPAGPSAGWPRAPACWRPSWPPCSSSSPPTPWPTPRPRRALRAATRVSFDRLDSDGCMSTNDTVLLLASGASGITPDASRTSPRRVAAACTDLAMQLLADAEGADHDIAITVLNAATEDDAVEVGPRASPAATCSSPRCSARTPTGAGCWPRSAPPARPSTRRTSTSPSTASGSAAARRRDEDPPGRPDRPRGHASPSTSRPATPGPPSGPTT